MASDDHTSEITNQPEYFAAYGEYVCLESRLWILQHRFFPWTKSYIVVYETIPRTINKPNYNFYLYISVEIKRVYLFCLAEAMIIMRLTHAQFDRMKSWVNAVSQCMNQTVVIAPAVLQMCKTILYTFINVFIWSFRFFFSDGLVSIMHAKFLINEQISSLNRIIMWIHKLLDFMVPNYLCFSLF